jgi:hypothetical protein
MAKSRELGLERNLRLGDEIIRRHMKKLMLRRGGKTPSLLTELARVFQKEKAEITRLEMGWGTFEGDMNRNIRIPLSEVPPQYREAYLSVLGEIYGQAAQAASKFIDTSARSPDTYTVFLKGLADADAPALRQFAEDLSAAGHEANIQGRPNGLVIDVNPKFLEDFSTAPIRRKILSELVKEAFPDYDAKIRGQEYDSIYIETPDYNPAIDRWKKDIYDEATNDIQRITKGSRTEARDLARGNRADLEALTAGKRRRVERIGTERRKSLRKLQSITRQLVKAAEAFDKEVGTSLRKLRKNVRAEGEALYMPAGQPANRPAGRPAPRVPAPRGSRFMAPAAASGEARLERFLQ